MHRKTRRNRNTIWPDLDIRWLSFCILKLSAELHESCSLYGYCQLADIGVIFLLNTLTLLDRRRRQLLLGGTGGLFAWCLPHTVMADSADELHTIVANEARRLAGENQTSLRMLIPAGSGENLEPIILAYREATGIQVEIIESPVDDINTQLTLDSMSGDSAYDLALPATFGLPDLVSSGAIVPLGDYAARHEPPGSEKMCCSAPATASMVNCTASRPMATRI